jgi:Ca-activated chloride channel homolog
MIEFIGLIQPYWLCLLPLPWAWFFRRRYWKQAQTHNWSHLLPIISIRYPLLYDIKNSNNNTQKENTDKQQELIFTIAISLLLLSLSQPVRYNHSTETEHKSEPVNMVLVVGTAITMSLPDYILDNQAVDRMSLTRRLLDAFVTDYSGSQIGLVILGNPPALWLPFTADKNLVRNAISRLRPVLGGRLSDIGASLQLVKEKFLQTEEKVVILVSDGGLQTGKISPHDAVHELVADGFTLYVLAIGSTDQQVESSTNSRLIYEFADFSLLQKLAEIGGGQFYHAKDSQSFKQALLQIEQKHRHSISPENPKRLSQAWYPLPLALSMLLLLAVFMLRKPDWLSKPGLK